MVSGQPRWAARGSHNGVRDPYARVRWGRIYSAAAPQKREGIYSFLFQSLISFLQHRAQDLFEPHRYLLARYFNLGCTALWLTAKPPRTRHPPPARHMLALYRLLPDWLLDRVILRFFGLPRARSALATSHRRLRTFSGVGGLLANVTGARSYDSICLVLLDGMTYPADGSAKGEQRERSSHRQS